MTLHWNDIADKFDKNEMRVLSLMYTIYSDIQHIIEIHTIYYYDIQHIIIQHIITFRGINFQNNVTTVSFMLN